MKKNIAILGAQFGDEAKGSLTHYFSKDYDWCIRTSSGNNCGHTIYRDGVKYVHNLMPSFDWRSPKPKAFLGSGMVIDLPHLYKETKSLFDINPAISKRIYVDPDAFVVLPEHIEEDKAKNGHIGTTNKGVGPAFTSKISRRGTRIRDVMNTTTHIHYEYYLKLVEMGVNFKGILELKPHFQNECLIFEGAQSVMLDIDHGTYPYVTSCTTTLASVYQNGFYWANPHCFGIAKCYSTRVGEGPFMSQIFGEEAEEIRRLGKEVGASTGRDRKCGWIDLPQINYAIQKGGIDSLIITKFDILTGRDKVKICDSYDKPIYSGRDFFDVKPNYIEVAGWKDHKDLNQLKPFINKVEEITKIKVDYITCGTSENDIIKLI